MIDAAACHVTVGINITDSAITNAALNNDIDIVEITLSLE
ncbi:hypothetical protein W909_12050 [Dickeya zeae EC1]|nr:hypothetical protein W909_12050 [Dickeya zeae EC1]